MIIVPPMVGIMSDPQSPPAFAPRPAHPSARWHFAPHIYGNPFQDLLYSNMAALGIDPVGHRSIEAAIAAIESDATDTPTVLHLHWLNGVLADASTDAQIDADIARFGEQLRRAKAAGAMIAWTVHNVLPHEGYQVEASVRVRKLMIAAADLIHVMSPDTVSACAPYFELPEEKVIRIEHPGYQGHYTVPATTDARHRWGLPDGGKVGVIIGGIKPYKGLNEFAAAFLDATATDPRAVSVVMAGKAGDDFDRSPLHQAAELSPNLHVIPRMLSDQSLGSLFAAADFAVVPYQNSLNSGALVLALSLGKPVLARASAGSTHLLADGAGYVYEDDSLAHALSELSWLDPAANAASRMADRINRHYVTERFASMCHAFIFEGVPAAQSLIGSTGGMRD